MTQSHTIPEEKKLSVNLRLYNTNSILLDKKKSETKPFHEWLIEANQPFLETEVKTIKEAGYQKIILGEISTGFHHFDLHHFNHSPPKYLLILPILQDYFSKQLIGECEVVFDPFRMAEIYSSPENSGTQEAGGSYKLALCDLYYKKDLLEKRKSIVHPLQTVVDNTKSTSLYAYIHRAALFHRNAKLKTTIIDLPKRIETALSFVKTNADLFPASDVEFIGLESITCTGNIDPSYDWSVRYLCLRLGKKQQLEFKIVNTHAVDRLGRWWDSIELKERLRHIKTIHQRNLYLSLIGEKPYQPNLNLFSIVSPMIWDSTTTLDNFKKFRDISTLEKPNTLGLESHYTTAAQLTKEGFLSENFSMEPRTLPTVPWFSPYLKIKINLRLYDVDRCLFYAAQQGIPIEKWLIEINRDFFEREIKEIQEGQYHIVILGFSTNRQDKETDEHVSERNGNTTCLLVLPIIQAYFSARLKESGCICIIQIDLFTIADLYSTKTNGGIKKAGESYLLRLKDQYFPSPENKKIKHPDRTNYDRKKFNIVYPFLHRTALQYPNAHIDVDICDDDEYILSGLKAIFSYSRLFPKDTVIQLTHYDGTNEGTPYGSKIFCNGHKDPLYDWTIRYFTYQYHKDEIENSDLGKRHLPSIKYLQIMFSSSHGVNGELLLPDYTKRNIFNRSPIEIREWFQDYEDISSLRNTLEDSLLQYTTADKLFEKKYIPRKITFKIPEEKIVSSASASSTTFLTTVGVFSPSTPLLRPTASSSEDKQGCCHCIIL
jgi:hypothetical protein